MEQVMKVSRRKRFTVLSSKSAAAGISQGVSIGRVLLVIFVALVVAYLLLPIVTIPLLSIDSSPWMQFPPPSWTLNWYVQLFQTPDWEQGFVHSMQVGVAVVALSLLLGVPASLALTRGRFRGMRVFEALIAAPMIIPYIIFGISIYSLYLRIGLNGTLIGLIIAHTVLALPFVVINVSTSLRTFDVTLEQAAMSCGAGPWRTFWHVTLPIIRSGVMAGGIMAFAISWDEVVTAIFITSPSIQTLPVTMWSALRLDLSPVITAVSTILILISLVIIVISNWFGGVNFTSAPSNEEVGV
ncbi:MAG: ABC transporter permease [Alicyclobacillus sp.]|nr:ABC transporter permease [Alicyclobacillus sp.]